MHKNLLGTRERSEWDERHRRQSRAGSGDGALATTEFQSTKHLQEFSTQFTTDMTESGSALFLCS
jgi:hypothetical protein